MTRIKTPRWMYCAVILFLLAGLCCTTSLAETESNPQAKAQAYEAATETESDDATSAEAEDEDEGDDKKTKLTPQKIVDLCKDQFTPHMAVVEYTLRFDKGEPPRSSGLLSRESYLGELVKQKRPLEIEAWLLDDRTVITADPMIHPRFIESIVVRSGQNSSPAKPLGYANNQYAAFYELAKPMPDVPTIEFDPTLEKPYLSTTIGRVNTRWTLQAKPVGGPVMVSPGRGELRTAPLYSLVTDASGQGVGMCYRGEMAVDGSWKGAPQGWPQVSADDLARQLDALDKQTLSSLVRVTLQFRSPKQQPGKQSRSNQTELETIALVTGTRQVLVLAHLRPQSTARLEHIRLNLPGEKTVEATFQASLKEYGAFVATLDEPMDTHLQLDTGDLRDYEDDLLYAIDTKIRGDQMLRYFQHLRITGFELGFQGTVLPEVVADPTSAFLFAPEKKTLLALPLPIRERVQEDRYGSADVSLMPASLVAKLLANLDEHIDPSNVPLREEEEGRLAWMGVYLQPLNEELARVNEVSHLTHNGRTGAMVSYVYPDSPAAQAGVEPGWILLRLHVEDEPKPIDVDVENMQRGPFPWDRLDQVPEQYYDRIPQPWPSAENTFTRMLTDLGIGTKYTADFFYDGKLIKKELTVTLSPKHFDTAAKFKSTGLGLTVRNLTYELRRFFRRPEGEPGVIISRIEPGSKASVAGLKPFELITGANDQPVTSVEDLEKLLAPGGEMKLSIKRWTKGRVVKIELPKPKAAEEESAESEDAPKADTPAEDESAEKATQDDTASEEASQDESADTMTEEASEEETDEATEDKPASNVPGASPAEAE
jgi:serine protease Do